MLPGPPIAEQVVRLSMDQTSAEGALLHTDVIVMRDSGAVAEVATETVSGTHSAQAEELAVGTARRLAQAVHST